MERTDSEKLKLFVDALTSAGIDARAAQPYAGQDAPTQICMVGCDEHDRARLVAALEGVGISNYVTFITEQEADELQGLMLQMAGHVQYVPELTVPISLKDLSVDPIQPAMIKKEGSKFFDNVPGYSRHGRARNQGFSKHFKHS